MSLTLDARQRAMLLEMGVRVWQGPSTVLGARSTDIHPANAPGVQASIEKLQGVHDTGGLHPAKEPAVPVTPLTPAARTPVAQAPSAAADPPGAAEGWRLLPTRLLYADADPARAPAALGAGWLIVTQAVDAIEPWADGAERLLAAMLHALQLHLHPRVALCALQNAEVGAHATDIAGDITAAIAAEIAAFAPSVVLVMGRGPVRAALGLSDPWAKLRERDLRIAGVPVVATYDAAFLLRTPACKRLAWADLCRARALAGAPIA